MTDKKDITIARLEKENSELRLYVNNLNAILDKKHFHWGAIESLTKQLQKHNEGLLELEQTAYINLSKKQNKGRIKLEKNACNYWLPYKKLFQEKINSGTEESVARKDIGNKIANDATWPRHNPTKGKKPSRQALSAQLQPK